MGARRIDDSCGPYPDDDRDWERLMTARPGSRKPTEEEREAERRAGRRKPAAAPIRPAVRRLPC